MSSWWIQNRQSKLLPGNIYKPAGSGVMNTLMTIIANS